MTEKNRKVNYPLMIILNVISTLLLICGAVYFLYLSFSDNPDKFTISFGFEEYKEEISKGIFLVCIIQYMILRKPLKKLLNQAVLDNEYDEFGVSKKKKFENLTRKEREEMDLQKAAQMEQLLSTSVLKRITKKGSTNPDEDLKKIIGLAPVKQKVTEMAARMKFEKDAAKSKKKSNSSYGMNGRHFCFYGSAGTGKTTFARIITGYLYQYGYIKENKLIEINGGFLKEGELSETKTKMIIQ